MKAAIATGIEDIEQYIHVQDDWPQPTLANALDGKTGRQIKPAEWMIVKVLACALAPGDCRLFKGRTDIIQLPKSGRPYVIGSDGSGIVTEVALEETYFQVGDRIIARFDEPQPHGMCAEYACVKTSLSEKCPKSILATDACTLPASAAAARLIVEQHIHENDRVLVLGASGGVGTFLCQYIKNKQQQGNTTTGFLAATTTQKELATSLGVDRVIDYRSEKWWALETEFQGTPFDVVVDLVNGTNWQQGACSGTKVLKRKALYLQLQTGVETEIDMRLGYIGIVPFVMQFVFRTMYSKLHPSCPRYVSPQGLDLKSRDLKVILEDIAQKRIRVVLDPAGPFQFDTKGVREAMALQQSIHAHGKVVIEIIKEQ